MLILALGGTPAKNERQATYREAKCSLSKRLQELTLFTGDIVGRDEARSRKYQAKEHTKESNVRCSACRSAEKSKHSEFQFSKLKPVGSSIGIERLLLLLARRTRWAWTATILTQIE